MIKHTLKIDFEAEEGALVRLLGLIQRRSFTVVSVTMAESTHKRKTVQLTVTPMDTLHRIEVLQKQIMRLQEVHAVEIIAQKQPRNVFGFLKRPIVSLQEKTISLKGNPSCLPENSSHAS